MMPAIGIHHTATSDEAWDGPGNVARLKTDQDRKYYARMFAWQDPDGDPKTKAAYKFPHHNVDGDGNPGAANIKGCQSGIGVLNGAMGGAKIPDGDRQAVYNHLAAHLKDADIEPADLRSYDLPVELISQAGVERRYSSQAELRADDQAGIIEGYAAVFDQPSEDLGGFIEIIEPGAFKKTIQEADIRALFNHDPNYVLGRNRAGTLRLAEDAHGLQFEVKLPDTTWARDLLQTVRRGDVSQASFGFQTVRDRWKIIEDQDEVMRKRTLLEVKLFDVSPVTYPAYPQTGVNARSLAEMFVARMERESDPDVICYLREQLSQLMSTMAPVQEDHPIDDEPDGQVASRYDQLRLELKKLNLV